MHGLGRTDEEGKLMRIPGVVALGVFVLSRDAARMTPPSLPA